MKLSTLMLASLITLGSTAAFAEGGAERAKAHYDNFTFMQQKTYGSADQTVVADSKKAQKDTDDKTSDEQQPKS
ncbi:MULTISPECIES: hypothetical protein [Pseudomonas]|uniref:hypothetical protein n=1 Tax=Pseudomonas TaxID=286 RepID=UPI000CFCB923|nr:MULTISPECIES: hypothetical protein [Pseudomonas]PQZ84384.1 hypothetical protein CQ048_24925 [Pseudomonas trivialis]PRB20470.1 hypothetical protein CQ041_24790 [Pseudomonas sp. MYb60]